MDESELLRVERELREFLEGTVLAWVLDEIDDAVAAGIAEEMVLRSRAGGGSSDRDIEDQATRYETFAARTVGPSQVEAHRKAGSLVITTRPMTTQERVEVLYAALRRVLVEAPEIEEATVKALRSPPEDDRGERARAVSIQFMPEEGSRRRTDQEFDLSVQRLSTEARAQLAALIDRGSEEIRS